MGTPKQLLEINGQTLVRRAATTALSSQVDEVIVVVGGAADQVRASLEGLPVRSVLNPDFVEGMSTSLRVGVQSLQAESQAVLVLLADQALLRPEVLNALVERYLESGAPIVLPSYAGTPGNPVLLDHSLFPELLAVQGDAGAREVVRRHLGEAVIVPFADANLQLDVDTWDEYQTARSLAAQHDG